MRFSSSKSQILTFATAVASVATILTAGATASAAPTCGNLFESRNEGILLNRAARTTMLLQVRKVLPPGRYTVLVNGRDKQTIAVRYENDPKIGTLDVQMMLNSRALVTTESSPMVTGILGNKSGTDASVQLRDGNRIVISTTQVSGDVSKVTGLTVREVDMTFPLYPTESSVVTIKETVINSSDYRPTEAYTVRTELQRVPEASKSTLARVQSAN